MYCGGDLTRCIEQLQCLLQSLFIRQKNIFTAGAIKVCRGYHHGRLYIYRSVMLEYARQIGLVPGK